MRQRTSRGAHWRAVRRYPEAPRTIGEHVRKRRLDLGLEQKEVAERLGVHFETLKNWERNVGQPAIGVMPRVIEFIGSNPLPSPTTFAERLVDYRACFGLRQEELARKLGVNPNTIYRWEAGSEPPASRKREIEAILAAGK